MRQRYTTLIGLMIMSAVSFAQMPDAERVQIKPVRSYSDSEPLTKPTSIVVYNFAATDDEVKLNKSALNRVRMRMSGNQEDKKTKLAQKVTDGFSDALNKDLHSEHAGFFVESNGASHEQSSVSRRRARVPAGYSDTYNSLVATNRSITVKNNYGFEDLLSTAFGAYTVPGITRIDLDEDGDICHTVWTNNQESIPNVVSQASLETGLKYTYSKDASPSYASYTDAWYFTAIDFDTGETVYKVFAGTGILHNNYYSSVYLGPAGKTAYVAL